jgi:hypothetical protein
MESRVTLESMPAAVRTRKAWTALVLGVAAQTTGTVFVSTPAFLIPLLHTERGMSLAQAGLLAAIPTMGMVLTLILWARSPTGSARSGSSPSASSASPWLRPAR